MFRQLMVGLVGLSLLCPPFPQLLVPVFAQSPEGRRANAADSPIAPFKTMPSGKDLAEEEDRIWAESRDAEKVLRRRGGLRPGGDALGLLQDITDQIYPEFRGGLRAHLINDPVLNAFAFPNGGLYFNLGLVARTESVSQLACVVGHEGAHFVYRHSHQSRQSIKNVGAFAMTAAMFGIVGALGSLAAVSSIFGYSRELESEADRVGHGRLMQAGFAAEECVKVFELMADEAKAMDIKTSVMFASHPKLVDRIESFKVLQGAQVTPDSEALTRMEVRFQAVVRPLRQAWMESALSHAQYASMIHYLERPAASTLMPAHYRYYLAEAYRLRAKEGDIDKAVALHSEVLAADKEFSPAYLGLGMALGSRGDKQGALEALKAYLARTPKTEGAAFAEKTIRQLEQ